MKVLTLVILAASLARAQTPAVAAVVNSGSYAPSPLPNSGVAPGSLVVIFGSNMGPASLTFAAGYPWPTSLSGTSFQVTVSGQTVNLPVYYTSATQAAGLLPSNTPVGAGTITVTYQGTTSATAPITVVQNNVGIYAWNQAGTGAGIVTFPDYSLVTPARDANAGGPYTNGGAANAGDTLILWTTGLGPVSGNETAGPLPGDMINLPVKVWVGGVAAAVTYRGRSGCCVGEDQIVFVVPAGPAGCAVPLVVQINNNVSNTVGLPIGAGSRTCTPNTSLTSSQIEQLNSKGQVSAGSLILARSIVVNSSGAAQKSDIGSAGFSRLTLTNPSLIETYADRPPFGSCTVTPLLNLAPISGLAPKSLDAGASLTVAGPSGSRTLNRIANGGAISYSALLGDTSAGNFLDAGTYTITGPGGQDVGVFSASIKLPATFNWTNQSSISSVNRAQGQVINWTGGDPNGYVVMVGSSSVQSGNNQVAAIFSCFARTSDSTFTIPPLVLLDLPASSSGTLIVTSYAAPVPFTASGLDFGNAYATFQTQISPSFQ